MSLIHGDATSCPSSDTSVMEQSAFGQALSVEADKAQTGRSDPIAEPG
jgi:hypothetical protein